MDNTDRERIIRDYISQAMSIHSGGDDEIPDLKGIARELGMTDEEIVGVERAAREHFERGMGYCRHSQWDGAIEELTIATALDPSNVDALYALASAYAGRWQETKNKEDRAEAERLIKRCIDLKPDNDAAFALVEQLSGRTPQAKAVANAQFAGRRMGVVFVSVAIGIMGMAAGIFFVSQSGKNGGTSSSSSSSSTKGRSIPVNLVAQDGATLQLEDALLYPDESVLCVKADVTPAAGSAAANSINCELDIIDSTGAVAEKDRFTAWPCTKHKGSFYFHSDSPIVPKIKEARLIIQ
jgi:tetratricopeptide (TPR) repeat protein